MTIILKVIFLCLLPVLGPQPHDLSESDQNGVRYFHGPRADSATQYADSYDGKHVCARDRAERERIRETGDALTRALMHIYLYITYVGGYTKYAGARTQVNFSFFFREPKFENRKSIT